jgi:N-acetylmuramoyl-L-alanine amidase
MVHQTKPWACLLETDFLTTTSGMKLLVRETVQRGAAKAIRDAVVMFIAEGF